MTDDTNVASTPEERTLTVIGNLTRVGGSMGSKGRSYSLMVTDRRLVFAEFTREKMKEIRKQAGDEARVEGKGRLRQWGAGIKTTKHYHERYLDMSPDAVLVETPGNFAIDRDSITRVKVKAEHKSYSNPELDVFDSGKVIMKTTAGKIVLRTIDSFDNVRAEFRASGLV